MWSSAVSLVMTEAYVAGRMYRVLISWFIQEVLCIRIRLLSCCMDSLGGVVDVAYVWSSLVDLYCVRDIMCCMVTVCCF